MKKLLSIITAAVALLSLSACSSTKTTNSTISSTKNNSFSFFHDAKTNKRLYFNISQNGAGNMGVNTDINSILLVDNGKATVYNTGGEASTLSLGDLKGLTDSQIIEKAKTIDENIFNKNLQKNITKLQSKSFAAEAPYNQTANLLQTIKYKVPQPQDLTVKVITDNTGNNISSEEIVVPATIYLEKSSIPATLDGQTPNTTSTDYNPYEMISYYDGTNKESKFDFTFTSTLGKNTYTIFDTKYTGYHLDNREAYLLTKSDNGSYTVLDKASENGLSVSTK
ncbi:hypothetical protein [Lactococcus lactis]|uniref:hypothetical protein n=1 Tax=Lactococcus lactis TaxID=1358 RepID=UPI001F52E463|nr:hypothetical protein [Lactococcus lactis]MCI1071876.1 hypothetical protein [Lactococcus lactis]